MNNPLQIPPSDLEFVVITRLDKTCCAVYHEDLRAFKMDNGEWVEVDQVDAWRPATWYSYMVKAAS